MRFLYRLAIYVLVTAIIEGTSIVVLFSYGYPDNVSGPGLSALLVALNIFSFFLWSGAIGGSETAPPQGTWLYNPLVQLVAGAVGMFVIVAAVGEATSWLGEKLMEAIGREDPLVRFNRQLDSAVHDFVGATYSSEQVQKTAETTIDKLYSERPERVIEFLSETLDRIRKMGTAKTAARVETLIKELQHRTGKEQSSETAERETP